MPEGDWLATAAAACHRSILLCQKAKQGEVGRCGDSQPGENVYERQLAAENCCAYMYVFNIINREIRPGGNANMAEVVFALPNTHLVRILVMVTNQRESVENKNVRVQYTCSRSGFEVRCRFFSTDDNPSVSRCRTGGQASRSSPLCVQNIIDQINGRGVIRERGLGRSERGSCLKIRLKNIQTSFCLVDVVLIFSFPIQRNVKSNIFT